MPLIDHCIDRSLIHGLGVFAAEPARKGDVVWRFDPRIDIVIPEKRLADLPPHVVRSIHVRAEYQPDQRRFVLSADGDADMNHSEAANLLDHGDSATAARDITVGDELTCDYRHALTMAFMPEGVASAMA